MKDVSRGHRREAVRAKVMWSRACRETAEREFELGFKYRAHSTLGKTFPTLPFTSFVTLDRLCLFICKLN